MPRLIFEIIFAVLLGLAGNARANTRTVEVTFLLFCDVYDMAPDRNGRGDIAKVAAVIRAEKAAREHVYVIHAGDALSPSLRSGLDRGAHMIDLLNGLDLDLFVPGNHEFDFGPEIFRQRIDEARFEVMAANLADADGKPLAGIGSHRMLEFDGVKIGVIGLTAEDSVDRSSPGDLTFKPSPDTALELSYRLRGDGADLIVLAAHAPRPVDLILRRERAVDIILSGDDHDLLIGYDGSSAFAEAMQDGWYVVAVDLTTTIKEDGDRP